MLRRKPNIWLLLTVIGGIIYPLLVYWGMQRLPSTVFIFIGLMLMGMRWLALRDKPGVKFSRFIFVVGTVLLLSGLFLYPSLASQAYPVIVSLSVAAIFGLSLLFPPTIVERIARLTEPNLSPESLLYTRRVTIVWTIFLVMNAVISAGLAVWGSLRQWTLWNGLISYLLMGLLFVGEYVTRRMVRR